MATDPKDPKAPATPAPLTPEERRAEYRAQLALEQEADPEVDLLLDIDAESAEWLRRPQASD